MTPLQTATLTPEMDGMLATAALQRLGKQHPYAKDNDLAIANPTIWAAFSMVLKTPVSTLPYAATKASLLLFASPIDVLLRPAQTLSHVVACSCKPSCPKPAAGNFLGVVCLRRLKALKESTYAFRVLHWAVGI
jgi:hypothetical protein